MPTSTFSTAVICWKRRMFWKVRPTPSSTTRCGGRPDDLRPVEDDRARIRMVDAGDLVEERRLAGAVGADQGDDRAARDREVDVVRRDEAAELLADLRRDEQVVDGRHQSSLGFRSVSAPSWVTSYSGVSWTPSAISILWRRSGISPVGPEQHHQHDDHAVDPELVLRRVEVEAALLHLRADRGQPLDVEVAEDHAAEDHPREAPHASEDHHAQKEHRDVEVEVRRERAGLEARVERAGDTAEERADRVRPGLRAHQRDAHRGGGGLVLADRDPGATEPRALEPPTAEHREEQEGNGRPVEQLRPVRLRPENEGAEPERVDRADPEGAVA